MTIIEALRDRRLFGGLAAFKKLGTWAAWLVFLKATYGLPLSQSERAAFCRHTGRSAYQPPKGGWAEVACIVGRQSGKSRVAALIAGFEAVSAPRERDGTETHALLVAQDQRAAMRVLSHYARAPFEIVPALRQSVATALTGSVTLENGVVLSAYPCRPAAVRGLRARVVVLDELAFYRSSENLPLDREALRAVRPCLATTDGKLVILSSPYGQSGALWDLHRRHYGQDDASTLVWQASAPEMNPTLSNDYLQRMEQDDPDAYRSEVLGEFRAGLAMLFDPDAITDCVADGVRERAPSDGLSYEAFCDPSGGRRDAFTVGIGHRDGDIAVLDVLRAWPAPFNPASVIAEAAELLKRYAVRTVTGDQYSAEFVVSAFSDHDVTYDASTRNRSAIYLDFLPLINSQRVQLLDEPELLRELRGLERRRGSGGRDRVDHGPGAHDDRANSAAGVLTLLAAPHRVAGGWVIGVEKIDRNPWDLDVSF